MTGGPVPADRPVPYAAGSTHAAPESPPLALSRVRAQVRTLGESGAAKTPYLLCDPALIDTKVARLRGALSGVGIHYAMKANPHPALLTRLAMQGVGFEVASIQELRTLAALGIPLTKVVFSNPVKPLSAVRDAFRLGVRTMAVDSREEMAKVAGVSRSIRQCLRLEVCNRGSDWPLSGKFGADEAEARAIIAEAGANGIPLTGLTFHVGSQCRNPDNWRTGIATARAHMAHMATAGLIPTLLNLGGGFPIQHTRPIPTLEQIGATITAALDGLAEHVEVICEPGRYLVGDCGWMVCRVIGTAHRRRRRWVYLDVGVFTGLTETLARFDYDLICDRSGPAVPTTVAGPTCDAADVLFADKMLPEDLVAGDLVYIPNAMAYTTVYAGAFNGFAPPHTAVLAAADPAAGRVDEPVANPVPYPANKTAGEVVDKTIDTG